MTELEPELVGDQLELELDAILEFSFACEYVIPELPSQHAIQYLYDTTPKSNALSTTELATHKSTISLALSDLFVVSPQLWMDLSLLFLRSSGWQMSHGEIRAVGL